MRPASRGQERVKQALDRPLIKIARHVDVPERTAVRVE
jgi:hypothetical protein